MVRNRIDVKYNAREEEDNFEIDICVLIHILIISENIRGTRK